jgi:hypothetical protein
MRRTITPDDYDNESGLQSQYTRLDWLQYKIDSVVSTQGGQVQGLAFISVAFLLITGALEMKIAGVTFDVGVWEAWNYMADPGTHSECINCVEYVRTDETGVTLTSSEELDGYTKRVHWETRALGIAIAWGGILFFAVVIGFIIDAIQEKMENLKKGKSNVVEQGHTVMLGWNQLSVEFIREIAEANESEGGGVIVVLCSLEKQVAELELMSQIRRRDLKGTKVRKLHRHRSR